MPAPADPSSQDKTAAAAEKAARKAERKSRKKRKFEQMLAGFQHKETVPFDCPVGLQADLSTRFLDEHQIITPSDLIKHLQQSNALSGSLMKAQLTPLKK